MEHAERAPIDPQLLKPALATFRESYTLPGIAYTSPDVFAWEMRHFFENSWVCLGRTDSVTRTGNRTAVRVGSESILLSRDEAGRLRAFFNVCRHRGHELLPVGGSADGGLIECPYHGWSYNLDGSLRSAPRLGYRPDFERAEHSLISVRVDEWQGWAFINVSGDAGPLANHLGNLSDLIAPWDPTSMVQTASMDYIVEANWKLINENYQECYHCPEIHPELCRVSPPTSGVNLDATGPWVGGWMSLEEDATTMSLTGQGSAPPLPGLDAEARRRVYYLGLFPNLLISPHPDYVLSHRLEPLSPTRTRIECRSLFPRAVAEAAGFDGSYASDFWDLTNRQDWAACESVQRSTGSRGFRPGPISEPEEGVYQLVNMIAEGYLRGRAGQPKNPTVLAKPLR